jgi:hypothetical protein
MDFHELLIQIHEVVKLVKLPFRKPITLKSDVLARTAFVKGGGTKVGVFS